MKKIRRLFVVLAAVMVVVAMLAACGETRQPNPKPENKVAPVSVLLNNLTGDADGNEGEGTLASPFTVSLADGKASTHNLTVRPAGADSAFAWTVGSIEDETFTASESAGITVTQTDATLKIQAGEQTGDFYVKGVAQTGDLTVYLKVTVTEYVELTSFTLDGFTAETDKEYDYYFKTAKGTTWNVGAGITARGQDLLDGKIFGGNQKPLNLSYYANNYKFEFTPVPANATDTTWVMTAADPEIFSAEGDGTWSANKAGDTMITVTNGAGEASVKIKLDVVDTLYPGIVKSEYDAADANTNLDWYFDENADDKPATLAKLGAWNLVVNKTTNGVNGDDGNQKIFYLGDPDRPYGIDLESRIDGGTPVKSGDTLALAWTKATIPAGASTLQAVIGNNNKSINSYRIVMVDETGAVHSLTSGWISKEADGTGTTVTYDIPAACKGKTVAVVIESTLTATNDNCEMHIKGVWINLPVQSVEFAESDGSASQGSSYQLEVSINPTKVTDSQMTYTVSTEVAGGEGKVTVGNDGLVSIATDAPEGDYTITVTSRDNASATDTFTLTVTAYTSLTGFTAKYTSRSGELTDLNGASFNEKQGASAYVLTFGYAPDDASVQGYDVTYGTANIASISTKENDRHELVTSLNFTAPGTTTVTVTPKAEEGADMAITFTVTVRAGQVLDWSNKDAILDEENGWTVSGNIDRGVGEGADLQGSGSYLSYSLDITEKDMSMLTLGARTFVRGGETNSLLWVAIVKGDGSVVRIKASNYDYAEDSDTIVIDTTDKQFDGRNEFTFDLSDFASEGEVEIRIGIDAGTHCCITDVRLS